MAEKTVVVFRAFPEGDVVALFPELPENREGTHCTSYMHVGQHSGADCDGLIAVTRPASPEEWRPLARELESIGYDLTVETRLIPSMRRKRHAAARKAEASMAGKKKEKLPRKVKSLADLKKILEPGGTPYEFYIALKGGLRSSKQMHYNDPEPGWYWVHNEIDGTEQELEGDEELAAKTHIVEAIDKGAFIYVGHDE